jgi:hypothetical protein
VRHKFGYYVIKSDINEVWHGTLNFWKRNRGKIVDEFISDNHLFRKLKIRHGLTLASYGEAYKMHFGYHPSVNITFVAVDIKLAFGTGLIWLKAVEMMEKWAFEMRIEPVKLMRRSNLGFEKTLIEIATSL